MNVIEATGLGKRYRRSWALRSASLAVPAGHVVALVGPNGAGKTTLLHMSVGLTRPTTPPRRPMTGFLQVLPVLVGVFLGGPVLARELETGTFRFAWTQGCGRTRWMIVKLALLAVAVIVAAQAFSLVFSWYFQPWFAEGLDGTLAPQLFDLRGIDFAAWTLLAFALGVAAGALIGRTVPAMAAALAVWTGLDFATFMFARKHHQAPLVAKGSNPGSSFVNWTWAQWYTSPNGRPLSQQAVRSVVNSAPASVRNSTNPDAVPAYLSAHHYTQWWAYQPTSGYWHFQFIEGGWLLVLSLLLIAGAVWLVRRRAA